MTREGWVSTLSFIPVQKVACCSLEVRRKHKNYVNEKVKPWQGRSRNRTSVMLNWSCILKTTGYYQELRLGGSSCCVLNPKF